MATEATRKWMQGAAERMKAKGTKGLFGKKAAAAGKTTHEYGIEKYHAAGKLGQEARFAINSQR